MIWQLRIGSWKFTFTMARVIDVVGVNSRLPDGKHILMWDFDDVPLENVLKSLRTTQRRYKLPKIYVLNSGNSNHWMAFCFDRREWSEAYGIVASTRYIDMGFLKYAVVRGHFTLRVSPKEGRRPHLVQVINSKHAEKAHVRELKSWVKYETLANSEEVKIWLLKISKNGLNVQTFQ
jgi:hypothetical protein